VNFATFGKQPQHKNILEKRIVYRADILSLVTNGINLSTSV